MTQPEFLPLAPTSVLANFRAVGRIVFLFALCFMFHAALLGQELPRVSIAKDMSATPVAVGTELVIPASARPDSTGSKNAGNHRPKRRITLEEVKQQSAGPTNPRVRLGQLQVEAAKQHRLAAESDYFPKLGSTLANFHFNKFMGQLINVQRPIVGGTATLTLPLVGKDQTLVAATATQPVTPLFKLHEVVNLARADERIAIAKAGLPVDTSSLLEENYYRLLVAQRQLASAQAEADRVTGMKLIASTSVSSLGSSKSEQEIYEAANGLATATASVRELTTSLNAALGWPLETELELAPPDLPFEDISLQEATDKALSTNPEVIEAEQNVAKARAASRLAKLDYIPDVAVLGGYAYNDNALPLLPRDFSFIGLIGSYTLFDFGKRQHTIKERNAQVEMAETALQLTKAKVTDSVKKSSFDLERSRQLSELRHRLASTIELQRVKSGGESPDLTAAHAKAEAQMYESDLEYIQALSRLKELMGVR